MATSGPSFPSDPPAASMSTATLPPPNPDHSFTFEIERVQKWTLGAIVTASVGFGIWIGTLNNKLDHIEKFVDSAGDASNGVFVRLGSIQKSLDFLEKTGTAPSATAVQTPSMLDKVIAYQLVKPADSAKPADPSKQGTDPHVNIDPASLALLNQWAHRVESEQEGPFGATGQNRLFAELAEYRLLQQLLPGTDTPAVPGKPNASGAGLTDAQLKDVLLEKQRLLNAFNTSFGQQLDQLDAEVEQSKLGADSKSRLKELIKNEKKRLDSLTTAP